MSDTTPSIATVLKLVGQAYRQTRHHSGRAEAEAAAFNAYCSLHPDVSEIEALAAVHMIIKASSEAGLIWIDS